MHKKPRSSPFLVPSQQHSRILLHPAALLCCSHQLPVTASALGLGPELMGILLGLEPVFSNEFLTVIAKSQISLRSLQEEHKRSNPVCSLTGDLPARPKAALSLPSPAPFLSCFRSHGVMEEPISST